MNFYGIYIDYLANTCICEFTNTFRATYSRLIKKFRSQGLRNILNIPIKDIQLQFLYIWLKTRGIQLWFYTAYITGRTKLPTFIYLPFRLLKESYISEFPYILTTLYEFYMNVDMQVICCTVTSVLSGTVGTVAGGKK